MHTRTLTLTTCCLHPDDRLEHLAHPPGDDSPAIGVVRGGGSSLTLQATDPVALERLADECQAAADELREAMPAAKLPPEITGREKGLAAAVSDLRYHLRDEDILRVLARIDLPEDADLALAIGQDLTLLARGIVESAEAVLAEREAARRARLVAEGQL